VANTLFNLALLLRERGDFAAAETIQRQVLALDRQHFDDNHPNLAYSLMSLGEVLSENGQRAEAERVFAEALEIRRAILAPGHPDLIKSLGSLALTRSRRGHYAQAEPLLREAVALSREHLGRHRILAGRLDDLGWLLRDLGRYDEALELHREALEIKLEVLGPQHKNTGITYMHLARSHQGRGDFEAALAAQERAVDIAHAAFGPENVFTATAELGLARIFMQMGRLDAADEHAAVAVASMRRLVPGDSPRLGGALQVQGEIHRRRGEVVAAERCLRQALGIRRDRLGAEHPLTAWSEVQLADLLLERGGREEAAVLAGAGVAVLERCLPADHTRVVAAREVVGLAGR